LVAKKSSSDLSPLRITASLSAQLPNQAPAFLMPGELLDQKIAEDLDPFGHGPASGVSGGKGATVQHPGWAGSHVGFMPFPTG
jgi:hypothetical protein